jgi:Uma2 family endonuclease
METLSPSKIPLSWLEIPDELRVSATLEEYWSLVDEVNYPIEFVDGEIFSFMSEASLPHEVIVARLAYLFVPYFDTLGDCIVVSSNLKIQPPDINKSLNADVSVIRGKPEWREVVVGRQRRRGLSNPEIIVEIFSNSTRKFDQTTKLAAYQTMPSLRHVLFVEQHTPFVRVVSRVEDTDEWTAREYSNENDQVQLGSFAFRLGDVYHNLPL